MTEYKHLFDTTMTEFANLDQMTIFNRLLRLLFGVLSALVYLTFLILQSSTPAIIKKTINASTDSRIL